MPAGVFVAVRLAAFAAAETDRRLTLLFAAPVDPDPAARPPRSSPPPAGRAVLITVAGLTDLGRDRRGRRPTSPSAAALAGAWNVLPIVLLCLGAAVLALGWAPRAGRRRRRAARRRRLPAAGHRRQRRRPRLGAELSPFAHLAAVPATGTGLAGAAAMTAIAVVLAALGAIGYQRRDLRA